MLMGYRFCGEIINDILKTLSLVRSRSPQLEKSIVYTPIEAYE